VVQSPSVSPPITWSLDPSVIAGVLLLSAAYVWGWRRARLPGQPHPPGYGRLVLFAASMLTTLVALVSPLDGLSDDLMVMHMIQHTLLLDLIPILMILSLTKGILRPITRRVTAIEQRVGPLAHPSFAVVMYVGMMVLWHLPTMYDLALRYQNSVHVLEHLCFAFAGTLFWWHLLSPIRARMRLGGMGPIVYITVAKLLVGAIGAILAFVPQELYPWYATHEHYWGLAPHVDQSLAGVYMALEQSLVMGVTLVWVVLRMFDESEREAQRRERFEVA